MGEIDDAFTKLEADKQRTARGAPSRQRIGGVSDSADAGASHNHAYGGRRIKIDGAELHRQGLLAPNSQARKLADEYRLIKRPLLTNAGQSREPLLERGNLLMISSALSGEGKTFTCMNLCLSIARERDWDVVLVDGDCSKSHLTRLFGAEKELGLMDLLQDPTLSFDSLVMPTNLRGLSLLPAGKRDEQASELLASARMGALCRELSKADVQRVVVFDSAPLLLTSEAPLLATQVGQIVLVVQANKTPREAVLQARDKLDPSKAIHLILNQADAREGFGAYGDYYGYGQ